MEEEKRYKIIKLKEDIKEEKRIIPLFSATSVAYAGISALLLYYGINNISESNYLLGITSTVAGTSFALSDIFVVKGLKEFIAEYVSDKERYNELSR